MTVPIRGLCSMATRRLLADLADALSSHHPLSMHFESAGGVEVARIIRAGARTDLAVLGHDEMTGLDEDGLLGAGTLRPLFVSDVVAAVPSGARSTPFSDEDELRTALLGADRIACSTGPSGVALVELIERFGLVDVLRPKLLQAPPGTPVGTLLSSGHADLGFQQRSEFSGIDGVRVLGPLPGGAAIRSTFSGAVLATSANARAADEVLAFLRSDVAEPHVLATGMTIAKVGYRP